MGQLAKRKINAQKKINQPLDNADFENITCLIFGNNFKNVIYLARSTFRHCFDRPLGKVDFKNITHLTLESKFNWPLDKVKFENIAYTNSYLVDAKWIKLRTKIMT